MGLLKEVLMIPTKSLVFGAIFANFLLKFIDPVIVGLAKLRRFLREAFEPGAGNE